MMMLRKTVLALAAVAAVGLAAPTMALARGGGGGGGHGGGGGFGGGHGGGFGGGGFHGGMAGGFGGHVGGFHGGFAGGYGHGFHHGFGHRFGGGGFYPYGYYDNYAYDDDYDNGSCYVVQRRVHTAHGWRVQPVQICS
jgi:hypothetical protein